MDLSTLLTEYVKVAEQCLLTAAVREIPPCCAAWRNLQSNVFTVNFIEDGFVSNLRAEGITPPAPFFYA